MDNFMGSQKLAPVHLFSTTSSPHFHHLSNSNTFFSQLNTVTNSDSLSLRSSFHTMATSKELKEECIQLRPQTILCDGHGDPFARDILAGLSSCEENLPDFDPMYILAPYDDIIEGPKIIGKCGQAPLKPHQHIRKGCGHIIENTEGCTPACVSWIPCKNRPDEEICSRCACPQCREFYAEEAAYETIHILHDPLIQTMEAISRGEHEDTAEHYYDEIMKHIREAVRELPHIRFLDSTELLQWLEYQRKLCIYRTNNIVSIAKAMRKEEKEEMQQRVWLAQDIIAEKVALAALPRLFPLHFETGNVEQLDEVTEVLADWLELEDTYIEWLDELPVQNPDGSRRYVTRDDGVFPDELLSVLMPHQLRDLVMMLPEAQRARDFVEDALSISFDDGEPAQLILHRLVNHDSSFRIEFRNRGRQSLA